MPECAKILPTGNPNHNVSLIFPFSSSGKKAPVLQFQLFRELFKENRTKNHKAFKNTKQAGGEGLFSISELTQKGCCRRCSWLFLPCGACPAVRAPKLWWFHSMEREWQLPIFFLGFIFHALQLKGIRGAGSVPSRLGFSHCSREMPWYRNCSSTLPGRSLPVDSSKGIQPK